MVSASGFQSSPSNRQWPPGVQKVGPESPVLTADEELKTFFMPPGYRVELVASEPMIQDPVALDWDTEGRLWAVEMPGFMADITGSNEHEPIGRVVVLEDLDRDGKMDKRHVFAEGLILARSIKVLDRGVLIAEPPNVWFMRDTNGDLRMDSKELVTKEYGRFDGDPQNNANGFLWALDNTMHVAGQSDIQLRLKDGVFEVKKTLQRGEWGVTQDDFGRIYRNTNESALHVDLVPTAYYARNPNLLRTRGSYERLADDNPELNTVWPVRPNPGTNRAYQTGIDRADGTLAKFTSVCAPVVYRGDRLPAEMYGNVFVAEPAANLVGRLCTRRWCNTRRAEGVRSGRFSRLDRRTVPARLHLQRSGRDALHRRHVSRHHRAPHLDHHVPARSDPLAKTGSANRIGPHLPRRSRYDHARSHGAARGKADPFRPVDAAGASEWVVAGHGAKTARRARRQTGRSTIDETGAERTGSQNASASDVDTRRHRRHSGGHGH